MPVTVIYYKTLGLVTPEQIHIESLCILLEVYSTCESLRSVSSLGCLNGS